MSLFKEMGIAPEIVSGLEELGFEKPTPVQEKVIPEILNSDADIIALAQTGTGKTAAFGVPMIQKADAGNKNVQAIVLSPTRELANQIYVDIRSYAKFVKNLYITVVYGGASIEPQIKQIKRGSQIIIGTPGRVLDLIRRGILDISAIQTLVLDEADEMLNMGFQEELDKILESTPAEKQTLLFSATMPKEIIRMTDKYMHDPVTFEVGRRNEASKNVKHEYYFVTARDKYNALKRIVDINPDIYGIVFCRTRNETSTIAKSLRNDGYNADFLNGDLSQNIRDEVMNKFREKHIKILVATDVAARGLDVQELTHVINYQLPDDPEVYIHRSGRTGRAGHKGVSVSIVHSRDKRKMRAIEQMSGLRFSEQDVPTAKAICQTRLLHIVDQLGSIEVKPEIEEFLPLVNKKLENFTKDEIIKQFVSAEFNQLLAYYKNAKDIQPSRKKDDNRKPEKGQTQQRDKKKKSSGGKYERYYINLGSKQNLDPVRLISLINEFTPGERISIGKIEIMKKFSFFEMEKEPANRLKGIIEDYELHGKRIEMDISNPKTSSPAPKKGDKRKNRRNKKRR